MGTTCLMDGYGSGKDSSGDMQTEWIRKNVEERTLSVMPFFYYHGSVRRNKF